MVVNLEGANKYMLTGQQHLREEHLLEINPSPHSLMEETWTNHRQSAPGGRSGLHRKPPVQLRPRGSRCTSPVTTQLETGDCPLLTHI